MSDSWRGHPIIETDGVWRYVDTGEAVADDKDRACGLCGKANTPEGYDGCLGELAGVMNACCGHGELSIAYVQFADGRRLGGGLAMGWALAEVGLQGDLARAEALIDLLRRGRS